jgi:hypothetical protein
MSGVETIAKWLVIMVSVGGFLWGVVSVLQARAIDARRPFLDLQLKLYQEATKAAAILATSSNADELKTAETRFWQLYWGELAMVENGGIQTKDGGVEGSMVRFGDQLKKPSRDRSTLQRLSLELAHTCRDSLAESWNVRDWRSPSYRAGKSG